MIDAMGFGKTIHLAFVIKFHNATREICLFTISDMAQCRVMKFLDTTNQSNEHAFE